MKMNVLYCLTITFMIIPMANVTYGMDPSMDDYNPNSQTLKNHKDLIVTYFNLLCLANATMLFNMQYAVADTRRYIAGSRYTVTGRKYQWHPHVVKSRTKIMDVVQVSKLITWNSELGTRNLELGTRNSEVMCGRCSLCF